MMRNKAKWHRCAVALLGRLARNLGIPTAERRIHSNKGGNAVGGEVTMSAPTFGVYVHLACPWDSYGNEGRIGGSYVRRASAADPYGAGPGSPNHAVALVDVESLAALCRRVAR